ncbi:MAG TPA: biliverdin-producing heme oxygenase [Candidatus Limnocylindria bacterium]
MLTHTPSPTPPASSSGARTLRDATQDVHRQAEAEPFIADLMEGRLAAADFARLTGQLRPIYGALEPAVAAMRNDPRLTALFDSRLDRVLALDNDLATLANGNAAKLIRPLPATRAYVDRIRAVAGSAPRLLAHHYVRYLGDLSGGQIIASLMRRHYGVPDAALTFYAFDGIGSKGGFKTTYRRHLDAVLADPAFYGELLDEARAAYEANRRVFAELDTRP